MQSARRAARKDDRRIEHVTDPVFQMRTGIDIDMQQGMPVAQFA